MMFSYDHDMGWWDYASMGIGMLLFWALIVVAIVVLIRFNFNTGNPPTPQQTDHTPSPEQLLANRYACGEIDETEFQQRITVLRSHARP